MTHRQIRRETLRYAIARASNVVDDEVIKMLMTIMIQIIGNIIINIIIFLMPTSTKLQA